MHYILLGNETAPPVCRDSVIRVENTLPVTTDDTESPGTPSDDRSSPFPPLLSSSDLPDIEEFLEYHKQLRLSRERRASLSSLPNSSLPSSPVAERGSSPEEDSVPGVIYFYEKAGEEPSHFEIPSSSGFFCPINSLPFLDQTRIITHPLKVYDTMKGGFVDLPPTAFWRQYSRSQYLIVKEKIIANRDCPGLSILIRNLEDPVDLMSRDDVCRDSWQRSQVRPPRVPSPELVRFHQLSYADIGIQTIEPTEGKKRKCDEIEINGFEPLRKVSRLLVGGSGDSFNDPIVLMGD